MSLPEARCGVEYNVRNDEHWNSMELMGVTTACLNCLFLSALYFGQRAPDYTTAWWHQWWQTMALTTPLSYIHLGYPHLIPAFGLSPILLTYPFRAKPRLWLADTTGKIDHDDLPACLLRLDEDKDPKGYQFLQFGDLSVFSALLLSSVGPDWCLSVRIVSPLDGP